MIVAAHERFVSGRPGGKRASLRYVDISDCVLSGRNLADADISASILDGGKLVGTKLDRATLFGSDLRKADLTGASLVRADLRGACLRGANLTQADLTQADFRIGQVAVPHPVKGLSATSHEHRHGQLDAAVFAGATLDESQMEDVTAFAADFTDCSMKGAKLSRANFKDANLSGVIFDGAEVGGANFEGANLSYAVMTDVDLRGVRTSSTTDQTGLIATPTPEAIARAAKDWPQSDALRDEIAAIGWLVKDTPKGQVATKS